MAKVDINSLELELREVHDLYPAWTFDNAFVHWFLCAFLIEDQEAAARAVTGVSHDKGVDAVLLDDENSKVFILQGKCHLTSKAPQEKRNDVLGFARIARILRGQKAEYEIYRKDLNEIVAAKLDQARRRLARGYALELYYVSSGQCSAPLKGEAASEVQQANGKSKIRVFDRQDVLILLRDYIGGAAPPVPSLDLCVDSRGIVGSDGMIQRYDEKTGIESWILTMTGKDVGLLYREAGDRLFARNIRGFLGLSAINDGMRKTLQDEADHFWYFNNGITIVCNGAQKTAEKGKAILRVLNPQVINGQQTTRTLDKYPQSRASVLIRVISIPRDVDHKELNFGRLVSSIVAATNWQNAIRQSDLMANDQRQIALERDLARLGYQYVRKRQSTREARRLLGARHRFVIKKDELAQFVAGCELDPQEVRSGKEGLFKDGEDGVYHDIFNGRPLHQYLSCYWLARVVKKVGSGYPDRSYAKWVVLNTLWSRVHLDLRKKHLATAFREQCERNDWNRHLWKAVEQLYLTALAFYRAKRGTGATAIDISNFFYRANLMDHFDTFWRSGKNTRRALVAKELRHFVSDMNSISTGQE